MINRPMKTFFKYGSISLRPKVRTRHHEDTTSLYGMRNFYG